MDAQKRYRIPTTAIALDLGGSLLIVLGILHLAGIRIPFLEVLPGDRDPGWTLLVFGIVFVIAATMLIVGQLLTHRNSGNAPPANRPH